LIECPSCKAGIESWSYLGTYQRDPTKDLWRCNACKTNFPLPSEDNMFQIPISQVVDISTTDDDKNARNG